MKDTFKAGLVGLAAISLPFATSADDAPQETIKVSQSEISPQQINFAGAATGKPVELIHGSGFNSLQASVVERTIENAGCPADLTVLGDGDQMMVNVAGKMVIVTDDVLDASSEAIEHCSPTQS